MGKIKEYAQNNKKNFIIMSIVASIVLVAIVGIAVGVPCGIILSPRKGTPSQYTYNRLLDFNMNTDGYVLKKSSDKDFKVLNIADLQMSEMYTNAQNVRNYQLVKDLVEQEKPDLLTFTGDNFWLNNAKNATKRFIKNIDSLGVPWAPVFGNHEPESEVDKNWIIEQFMTAKNCIFKYGENVRRDKDLAKGPINIDGIGNYVINVVDDNNKIVHTIFMVDSHSNNDAQHPETLTNAQQGTPIAGLDGWCQKGNYLYKPDEKQSDKLVAVGTTYDYIKQNQIEWYEWVVKGVQKINNGEVVQSSAYFHIPLPEFNIAYAIYKKTLADNYNGRDKNANGDFGLNRENVCSPYYNSGFFAMMKALDSTKDVVCGHDHVNNSSIEYEGIRLTYGLKTGDGCYWDASGAVSGGTIITINGEGKTVTEHKYLPFK